MNKPLCSIILAGSGSAAAIILTAVLLGVALSDAGGEAAVLIASLLGVK